MSNVALILGASKGLGAAISQQCRDRGWLTAIDVASSLSNSESNGHITRYCDLSDLASVQTFLDTVKDLPPISHFFWVAGILLKGEFCFQQPAQLFNTVSINFGNSLLIAHRMWQEIACIQQAGSFTVISSSSGVNPRQDEAVYAACKHAQVGFTRSLALENKNPKVKISLFLPGGMRTEFWRNNLNPDYEQFLDPTKVAAKIVDSVADQQESFLELAIPRGSL